MIVDCDTCVARGPACGDCVVTSLLGLPEWWATEGVAGDEMTALAVLAATAAFLLAVLLTLSSVGKRVRELGTLKALGWTQWLVVRQVMGESLAQGVLGGLIGVVLALVMFGSTLSMFSIIGIVMLMGLVTDRKSVV